MCVGSLALLLTALLIMSTLHTLDKSLFLYIKSKCARLSKGFLAIP